MSSEDQSEYTQNLQQKSDTEVLKLAILSVAATTLASIGGSIFLIAGGHEIPEGLIALGSAGIGGLATMLSRR